MYAYIKGAVAELLPDRAIIEANGVGYELNCSALTLKRLTLGTVAKLYTHLHLAEGVMALYAFYDEAEREMFRKLLSVSRVGPKLALSVLSQLTPSDVRAAIITDNPSAFDRVAGMGRKTAQRVILELAGLRSGEPAVGTTPAGKESEQSIRAEAVQALTALGYDGLSATRAVSAIESANSVEELLKSALRALAK